MNQFEKVFILKDPEDTEVWYDKCDKSLSAEDYNHVSSLRYYMVQMEKFIFTNSARADKFLAFMDHSHYQKELH